jgi:DNA-binding CsgD family transcriptional regulator
MSACFILAAANDVVNQLAEQNIGLLYKFVHRHKNTNHFVGGARAFQSELVEAYMRGITRWVFRKKKHRKLKLSTFVWKSFIWQLSRIWSDGVIRVSNVKTGTAKIMANRREAKKVVFFHGSEGRCEDSALLVHEDHGIDLDRAAMVEEMANSMRFLSNREKTLIKMRASGLTLEECGEKFGFLSKERVRQIILHGNRKLREKNADALAKFAYLVNGGAI